ncbi:hypothetical protein ACIOD1_24060 [Streptomyces sp. NPDC088097]|uniref:hypothetical protein n=1 Tax=Streptomyces sp. NPDC088097 TaxID=3365823 RepID=UPI003825E535
MELEKTPPPRGEGCLVGFVRIPVKIVAVLVVLPVRVLWDLLVAFGRTLHRRILGPVGQGLRWFHARAVRPVSRGLGLVVVVLLKLVFVWPWIGLWRCALAPIGQGLAWLGRATLSHVLAPLGRGLARLGRAGVTHLWDPLVRSLLLVGRPLVTALVVWPSVALWRYVLVPVAHGLALAGRGLAVAIGWLCKALFVWPWVALWRYVLVPLATAGHRYLLRPLGRAVVKAARGLHAHLLTPLGHLLVGAWHLAGRVSRALGRGVRWWWRGCVARPAAWAYRRVATPVGHAVREVWRTARATAREVGAATRTAVREARVEVWRALFGEPEGEPARSRARTLGSTTAAGNTPAPAVPTSPPRETRG